METQTNKQDFEKIVDKIQKLMNVANDPAANPNEAANAANMAEKLMRKHNIDYADVILEELKTKDNVDKAFAIDDWDHAAGRYPLWMSTIAIAVGDLFDCHVRYEYTKRWSGTKPCANVMFFGYKSDIEVARITYSYLVREVNRLADQYWNSKSDIEKASPFYTSKGEKNTFRHGAAHVIVDRINQIVTDRKAEAIQPNTQTTALVVLADAKKKAVEEKFGDFKYSTTEFQSGGSNSAYEAGRRAGHRVSLNRQVADKTEKQARIA
jgi:hypothetical protein